MEYIPAIIAFIGVALTAYVNLRLGRLKSNDDSTDSSREAILELIDKYETREKRLSDMVDKLQTRVQELLDQVDALRTENRALRSELQDTREELGKFERKVFYIPPEQKTEKKSE